MRLELELGGKTYWVEFKDSFTRRETKQWYDTQELRFPEPKKDKEGNIEPFGADARDEVLRETEKRMLELLGQWCSACFLEDAEGKIYNSLSELSPDTLDGFDWSLLDFLFNVPLYARAKRSRLGEVVGLPLLRTTR